MPKNSAKPVTVIMWSKFSFGNSIHVCNGVFISIRHRNNNFFIAVTDFLVSVFRCIISLLEAYKILPDKNECVFYKTIENYSFFENKNIRVSL